MGAELADAVLPFAMKHADAAKHADDVLRLASKRWGARFRSFTFRGARRIDGLREATHADIVKAFEGTGLTPTGHFIRRLKDRRLYNKGFRTFKDLETIFRKGEFVDAEEGVVAVAYRGVAVLFDPKTGNLVNVRPW